MPSPWTVVSVPIQEIQPVLCRLGIDRCCRYSIAVPWSSEDQFRERQAAAWLDRCPARSAENVCHTVEYADQYDPLGARNYPGFESVSWVAIQLQNPGQK